MGSDKEIADERSCRMKKWAVVATIKGTAACEVYAETYEDAIEAAKSGGDWDVDDWDLDTSQRTGGYIDAMDEDDK